VATAQNQLPVLQDPVSGHAAAKAREAACASRAADYSQRVRYTFQSLFLVLNVALGNPVLSLRASLRIGRADSGSDPSAGGRGLAPDRGAHESQVSPSDRENP